MTTALIEFDEDKTVFLFPNGQRITLAIGYKTLMTRIKGQLPTPYETEFIIMLIEDQIALMQTQWICLPKFMTANLEVAEMIRLIGDDDKMNVTEIERLFNHIADVISGMPWDHDEPVKSLKWIVILIMVREFMHHLRIENIQSIKI